MKIDNNNRLSITSKELSDKIKRGKVEVLNVKSLDIMAMETVITKSNDIQSIRIDKDFMDKFKINKGDRIVIKGFDKHKLVNGKIETVKSREKIVTIKDSFNFKWGFVEMSDSLAEELGVYINGYCLIRSDKIENILRKDLNQ